MRADQNLARLWADTLDRLGDYPAVWFEGAWHGSAELFDRAATVAGGLLAHGLEPGDRVAVVMANCPEVGVTYHAVWRAGGVATPVMFLLTADELRAILADCGAVLVVTTADLLPKVNDAAEGLDITVVVVGGNPQDNPPRGSRPPIAYASLEDAPAAPIAPRGDDDLAALLYTGGTTGRSKGVALTHANLYSGAKASREVSHVDGLNRSLMALPVSHSFGLMVTVGAQHLPEPENVVLMRWFDARSWLQLAQDHHVQHTAVVPAMIAALLAQPLEDYDLSHLRNVYSGAAPLPPSLVARFESRVPGAQVLEGYGCTETGGIATSTKPGQRRIGTVGRPVPGVEVAIVGADGTAQPAYTEGEVVVRGPNVMAGYWPLPSGDTAADAAGVAGVGSGREEANLWWEGSWLRTGDIGRSDEDGYLTIVDRKKDLILRGGYNIYPRDIEEALLRHPLVTGAGVVGRPDARLGEEVVAFVTVAPDRDQAVDAADVVMEYAREHIAPTKYPREIRVVPSLPMTSVGKLNRRALRDIVLAESAGATEN